MKSIRLVVSLLAIVLSFACASSSPAANFGAAASVGTISPCPSFCGGPGSHLDSSGDGGEGFTAAATSLTAIEGFGSAFVSLSGETYLPLLGVFADSNPNARVSSQAVGYNASRYVGSEPITVDVELVLEGSATLDASGRASVAVILGDDLPFYTHYATLVFEEVALNPELELLGTTELFLPVNVGNTTVTGSIPIDLEPGDKFFVWASLLGSGVRNGLVDADNTFSARFSDPTDIISLLVPEPAGAIWAFVAAAAFGALLRTQRLRAVC